MSIGLKLRIVTPERKIKGDILGELARELEKRVYNTFRLNKLLHEVKYYLQQFIEIQPEYLELKGGELRAELGIADTDAIDKIIRIWIRGIELSSSRPKIVGAKIYGSITIFGIPQDYSDVFGSSAASYITEKGAEIPWLKWLLTGGNETFVVGYNVAHSPRFVDFSRTGDAIMIHSKGDWRIPSEFQGVEGNNFITKAIAQALPSIEQIFIQNIQG